ncbi:hypothetical protein PR048_029271 [Dryococelus australis]|uniref:Uncharacterized protein n=1 Tax=Dryococelus australis TaxID=614101 RepID=A0ABQ9GCW6_9NEOP|nr:hypothetical protein PR048_029271 [Dryococelus australis]
MLLIGEFSRGSPVSPTPPRSGAAAYSPRSTLIDFSRPVIEMSLEQRRNERAGETRDPREDPPTNGIVRHDSHMRGSGVARPGIEPGSPCDVTAAASPVKCGGNRLSPASAISSSLRRRAAPPSIPIPIDSLISTASPPARSVLWTPGSHLAPGCTCLHSFPDFLRTSYTLSQKS